MNLSVGARKGPNKIKQEDFIKCLLHFLESFLLFTMVLNITTDLVLQCACGLTKQQRRDRMTVLCFAIWCKMQHSNSVIFDMSVRQMKKSLGIGQSKAEYLLDAIKTNEMFEVLPGNRFKVVSFKDDTIKQTRKGKTYKGANVFTIKVDKEYKLRDIYNKLNELLFLRPIGSNEANSSHVSGKQKKSSLCCSSYITMKEFQSSVGMSHGSCSKIKKRLVGKGEIKSTFAEVHMADRNSEEQTKRMCASLGLAKPTFFHGDKAFGIIPCSYTITNREAKASCGRHKIYGYRATRGRAKEKMERQLSVYNMPD